MLLYKYDKRTKEYLGYFEAYLDPLETEIKGEEVYVIPPCSTQVAPNPPETEGNVVCFNEKTGEWEEFEDHRGLRVWSKTGEPSVIENVGPIPEGLLLERPVSLRELKDDKINEIKRLYNEAYFKKILINETEVGIDDSFKIQNAINSFGEFKKISVNLGDDVLEGTKEELEEIVKKLYVRSMLLTQKRKSLIINVREQKSKEFVKEIKVDFDVEEETERLKEFSTEELANQFN